MRQLSLVISWVKGYHFVGERLSLGNGTKSLHQSHHLARSNHRLAPNHHQVC